MVEIGYIDINSKASLLFSYSAMQIQGHVETVLHIMGYLKHRHNSTIACDASYPNIDSNFQEYD